MPHHSLHSSYSGWTSPCWCCMPRLPQWLLWVETSSFAAVLPPDILSFSSAFALVYAHSVLKFPAHGQHRFHHLPFCAAPNQYGSGAAFSCLEADSIHNKVIMEMLCIAMRCHQYLIFWELPLCKFQTNLMDFCWCNIRVRRKGLHKLIKLSAVYFLNCRFVVIISTKAV